MKTAAGFATNQDPALLFEPDVLAPNQFHDILRSGHMPDPERRLMVAMLEDAVSCLSRDPRRCAHQEKKSFDEAYSWINATDAENWVFSFTNVCETLGFDPTYLRHGLNRWSTRSGSGAAAKPRLNKYRSGARRRKLRFRAAF
ncbi:MAG: hypothetical protein ACREQ2_03260 [Candidatus Binatia bacterium]